MLAMAITSDMKNSPQEKTHCLGLIAGLGVGAAIHYYKALALAAESHNRALDMVMAHAQTSRVFEYVDAADPEGLAVYLNGFLARLHAAGAQFAVIPAVTPHYCIRELQAISPTPILSIFEPLNRELASRRIRRISIFATRQVMDAALYGQVYDAEVIPHPPEELQLLHETYLTLLNSAAGTTEQHRALTTVAHTILKRDHVDAIVLAGTDLALVFNEANTDFPHLDCAALHLQAIKNSLFG
jgi:aspartate racemase